MTLLRFNECIWIIFPTSPDGETLAGLETKLGLGNNLMFVVKELGLRTALIKTFLRSVVFVAMRSVASTKHVKHITIDFRCCQEKEKLISPNVEK